MTKPQLVTAGDIKREARAQLARHWKDAVLMHLILMIVLFLIGFSLFWTFEEVLPDSRFSLIIQAGQIIPGEGRAGLLASILAVYLVTAIAFTFLEVIRHMRREISPLKNILRNFKRPWIWKIISLYLVRSVFVFLWSLLLIIPGIIKSYSYSQSFYILYDDITSETGPSLKITDCITESRALMKGHKLDLFGLQLSFILWNMLSIFTLGIAFLWVGPYQNMSLAIFYENLRQRAHFDTGRKNPSEEPNDYSKVGQDPDDFSDL